MTVTMRTAREKSVSLLFKKRRTKNQQGKWSSKATVL